MNSEFNIPTDFKNEMKEDLVRIKRLINVLKDKKKAVKIEVGNDGCYWVEKNKHAIKMLKKERKLLKKKLNWQI